MRKLANCRVSFRGIKTSRVKALRSLLENEHDKYGESYARRTTMPIFTHSDLPEETLYIMDGTSMIFNAYYRFVESQQILTKRIRTLHEIF